jgi:hypothetical protein
LNKISFLQDGTAPFQMIFDDIGGKEDSRGRRISAVISLWEARRLGWYASKQLGVTMMHPADEWRCSLMEKRIENLEREKEQDKVIIRRLLHENRRLNAEKAKKQRQIDEMVRIGKGDQEVAEWECIG